MAPLADALEGLGTDSELKSKVVFRPGLEPFVKFDLQGKKNVW